MRKINWWNVVGLALIVLIFFMIGFYAASSANAQEDWASEFSFLVSHQGEDEEEKEIILLLLDIVYGFDETIELCGTFIAETRFEESGLVLLEHEPTRQTFFTLTERVSEDEMKFCGTSSRRPRTIILAIDGEEYTFSLSRIPE